MGTVILVSVLSTLCAVALIASIVVAYKKINDKVDVKNHEQDIEKLYLDLNEIHRALESLIDSRCDKLHSLINDQHKTKQILKS